MSIDCKKNQVYEHLKREILTNQLAPGSRLPCEVVLARTLGVGHVTLRSALARLEKERLIERMRSKGTFVTDRSSRSAILLIQPDGAETLETPSRYIVAGIELEAEKNSIPIERCPTTLFTAFSDRELNELKVLHNIGGIILETGHATIPSALIVRVQKMNLPTVIPHGMPEDAERSGFLVLRTNERAAFSDAFRYLAGRGHRRIASMFFKLPSESGSFPRGFSPEILAEFLNANGLCSDRDYSVYLENDDDAIRARVRKWMLGPKPPTAILCHSDRIAMRVYAELKELDLRIPAQISIMGYCNYPGSQLLLPALTTIDVHYRECGQTALRRLLEYEQWFRPGITPPEEFTRYELIERASVGDCVCDGKFGSE